MSKFDVVAGILFHAASYLDTKQKNKFMDRLAELLDERDNEKRKPSYENRDLYPDHKKKDFRDNNVIDRNYLKLLQLGETYNLVKGGRKGIRDLLKTR